MNWDDLRIVLAVAREGTLAAAGRVLKIDATTVGRRILTIEGGLGVRLFERMSGGYVPTRAGHQAAARAEQMEHIALTLAHEIEGSDGRVEGTVRLTGLDATFDHLIIPRLPRLIARHPGLELTFASNLEIVNLTRRQADLALRPRRPVDPDAVGRKLGLVALGAYAAVSLELGNELPLVGLPANWDDSNFVKLQRKLFPKGRFVARGNSEGHLLALVRAGVGVGLLDCYLGDADPLLRRVIAQPVEVYGMWAEAHFAMFRAARVQAVLEFVGDIFEEEREALLGRKPPRGLRKQ